MVVSHHHPPFFPHPAHLSPRPPSPSFPLSPRYRGKGTDMSRVSAFERHANDTGSPEAQIARLSARVTQLTTHLQEHNKDYASRRGLEAVLASRKNLLKYLFDSDRNMYNKVQSH